MQSIEKAVLKKPFYKSKAFISFIIIAALLLSVSAGFYYHFIYSKKHTQLHPDGLNSVFKSFDICKKVSEL